MAMRQFKAESKKLLDLMINSIYTNREIFLRELISNASDACDKLYFKSLTDTSIGVKKEDLSIHISPDKDTRTLTVSDNGIGMTKEELEKNLGTIARSGSMDFKAENKNENIDIIGQFGVGFYSAFMVASKVTVISRAQGSDEAWKWESKGVEGYTLTEAEKDAPGTEIIMVLKEDTDGENYSQYLEEYTLVDLIKKYSDYIRYPITMYRQKSRQKPKPEDAGEDYKPEYETYTELETINSMVPIWKRNKKDVEEKDYNEFYKSRFNDYSDPLRVITSRTEGTATYTALLFIPGRTPYDYYTKEYEKGLALYASGVLIMDKCADLLPDYFSFVKGVVDSEDLSLNISRETLQKDNQLKLMHNSLEKKIKNELHAMLVNDREKYETFWKSFGRQIKFGIYGDYGMHKDLLADLLMFWSAKEQKYVTLDEYIEKMPEDQKCIYFAAGDENDRLAKLPNAQLVLSKGYDLLLCPEDVDEFCLQMMHDYKEKEFKNINSGDLGLETEEEKEAAKAAAEENKDLFEDIKTALKGKIKEVKANPTLKDHPMSLSSEGGLSMEMEKVLRKMPNAEGMESTKVLELNPHHPVFAALKAAKEAGDSDKVTKYAELLYDQALLIEGLPLEDPVAYAQKVCELMK
ncbi:molecular chaperone HtpG [Subdoligranulum sp. DSM 109015]|uniref:Chaperone protein HtpG n=1 Tax=Gemmiger gallinarum TaxID=2779354 RepID=A0ABR9R1C2_9FIRM|nr:molecular chaperone HtpG [Gemmiger gallinarum]MBE5036948.1 molecular chaperone HtpG [Gemmiger gallinarum]